MFRKTASSRPWRCYYKRKNKHNSLKIGSQNLVAILEQLNIIRFWYFEGHSGNRGGTIVRKADEAESLLQRRVGACLLPVALSSRRPPRDTSCSTILLLHLLGQTRKQYSKRLLS